MLCSLSYGQADHILNVNEESHVSASGPYEGEVLQLAAYCLLVEEHFERTVQRGQLQYPNRTIDVPFDVVLRGSCSRPSRRSRTFLTLGFGAVTTTAHCRAGGFRSICGDSLGLGVNRKRMLSGSFEPALSLAVGMP